MRNEIVVGGDPVIRHARTQQCMCFFIRELLRSNAGRWSAVFRLLLDDERGVFESYLCQGVVCLSLHL